MVFPGGAVVKNPSANAGDTGNIGFDPWVRMIPWRKTWQPTPGFLPGKLHGQRSLVGYSLRGCKESDTTKATSHLYMSIPSSRFIPPLLPFLVSIRLFSMSVFLFLFCKDHLYHFSRFHLCANIQRFFSDLFDSVWQSLGPSLSLQMTQFHPFSMVE